MFFIRRISGNGHRLQSLKDILAKDGNVSLTVTPSKIPRLPEWFKIPIPVGPNYHKMKKSLEGLNLSTVTFNKTNNLGLPRS